ncbi:hypothetical protein VTK73DRAFT_9019 [Phialemonium thermophilum]|uniref:Uncharacterized protein n=1 Tax=Phialemonium thermophilum TaxID=223376 RepID=A0ABR3W5C6_9PEZI
MSIHLSTTVKRGCTHRVSLVQPPPVPLLFLCGGSARLGQKGATPTVVSWTRLAANQRQSIERCQETRFPTVSRPPRLRIGADRSPCHVEIGLDGVQAATLTHQRSSPKPRPALSCRTVRYLTICSQSPIPSAGQACRTPQFEMICSCVAPSPLQRRSSFASVLMHLVAPHPPLEFQ